MFSAFDLPTRKKLAAAISCISIDGVGLSLVIPLLACGRREMHFIARSFKLNVSCYFAMFYERNRCVIPQR